MVSPDWAIVLTAATTCGRWRCWTNTNRYAKGHVRAHRYFNGAGNPIDPLPTCSTGQTLKFSASWICADDVDMGAITNVTAGFGLTGGTTGSTATLHLNTSIVPLLNSGTTNVFNSSNVFNGSITFNAPTTVNVPIALSGLSSQTSGAPAVQGIQLGSGSSSVAVYGQGYFGVTGRSNSDGIGVTGRSDSPNGIGVHGQATFPGAAGIVGVGGQGGHAGRFLGDVVIKGDLIVEGSVSKKGGTFRIDHPLDPANKYLSHSFVESPDMMNVYNDNAVLGDDGTVWVQLPAYFEALNRDFRYQLTAIGGPGPNLFIAEEIQGNRFKIAGGSPGLKVSWHVTGIRQDAYANDHPVIVEQDKPASERGSYLYPGRGSR